ncbi:nif11-like peptide radical SAM maturase [Desulfosporosinus youngiae]|uniref:Nif11-class bacteriocin maturation radical SAM enzyme n=1 Tax=Desulfosporosinus youngiae DSM 17734 TaxID=768710 RepID=H5Y3E8_9FIRM|nr:nif11-like peptide radical SAM maturase [Desulfosporosinus youngiae]EHQ88917.1 nif11-class bacteriocin maturation radical SAM enzyme [Desulfosporosinus youngiae DSM 17734]
MSSKDIMPFHLFYHQGSPYVINIEGMCAKAIDAPTAKILESLSAQPEVLLSAGAEKKLQEIGIISEGWEKKLRPLRTEPYPIINMCLFLTQSCNLNCVYCYGNGGGYGTGGSLEEKTAYQAVDWLIEQSRDMKKIHLGFFGGEPFLKFPLMKEIVAYTNKRVRETGKEVRFHCTTNATLLDDEQIAFIRNHSISVMISIDGPREIHNLQRPFVGGQGSYDVVVPKIKNLLTFLPDTPGHAVIVGNTDPQVVKDAMKEIGFQKISVITSSQSLFCGEADKQKAERDISNLLDLLEQEAETWISLTRSRDVGALLELKNKSFLYFGLSALFHNKKLHYACSAGLGMVAVSVTGDVYLCQRFVGMADYKIGSVFESKLNREQYQESPARSNPLCTACLARYYCAGGCKHDNVGSRGSLTTPSEEICRLRRRELELAAAIIGCLDPEDLAFLLGGDILPPKPCPLDF